MALLDPRADRLEPRIPFFTPVIASGLDRCWATNISTGGLGMTAIASTATPDRGDELEIEFELGESKQTIRAVSRIAWTSMVRPDGRFGLGIQFHEISAESRGQLAMFLAGHRPRAMIALASDTERELASKALGHLDLDFVASADQIDEDMFACASIVIFSHDANRVAELLQALTRSRTDSGLPGELPLAPITMCTALDSDRLIPLLTGGKVYEVLRLPIDRRTLTSAVERSCERWALQMELRWASLQLEGHAQRLQRAKRPTRDPVELPANASKVVRTSPAMQRVYGLIRTVAVHDVPVLLVGETGTGKELAAREIHAISKRAKTPFVAQDCGALTETLLESELFGHVKGAFTGATSDHPGLFQIADGGTIFLDEIQNTSPGLQAKLLRVVEEGEVRPVGSAKSRKVDVRLIAACNVDLRRVVKEQQFRADFYYRLNRFPIELPPLREHPQDIPPLIAFFVARLCESLGRPLPRVDPKVERALLAYDWPGNIRELKNALERALLLTPPGEPLRWETLPDDIRGSVEPALPASGLDAQVADFERRLIEMALERNDRVIRRAARELRVNAVTLSRKMRRLGLE